TRSYGDWSSDVCSSDLLVGHRGHDEVTGILGEAPGFAQVIETLQEAEAVVVPDPGHVGLITQTTLSVDDTAAIVNALRRRFPKQIGRASCRERVEMKVS